MPDAEKDSRLKNYSTFLEASLLGKISLIAGAPRDGGQGQGYRVGARMSMNPWGGAEAVAGAVVGQQVSGFLCIKYVILMASMTGLCVFEEYQNFFDTLLSGKFHFISCL